MLWQAQNLWKVNSKGLELISEIKWSHSNSLNTSLKFLYTYNASTTIGDESANEPLEDKQLILVPKHMLMIPLLITYKSIAGGIDYQFTGIRYSDRNNTNSLDPYHLLDLLINYAFKNKHFSISFRLKNILNYSYQTYPGQPMPGINYNLQLSWKLK